MWPSKLLTLLTGWQVAVTSKLREGKAFPFSLSGAMEHSELYAIQRRCRCIKPIELYAHRWVEDRLLWLPHGHDIWPLSVYNRYEISHILITLELKYPDSIFLYVPLRYYAVA